MAKVTKDLEDVIGKDKVEEIVDKDWKVAELPSEEELAQEKNKSPKARNNPNSRKNLVQYNKRTKEQKKKSLDNLKVTEVQEDVNPKDIFTEDTDDEIIDLLEKMMPATSVLVDRDEQLIYYNTVHMCLKDFTIDELSFSDMDDIITLAVNRVLEQRLLKVSRKSEKMLLEAGPTLEKFRKHSDKIKQNLASRRVDRIDTKNKPAMSIVELCSHLDGQKKLDFEKRLAEKEKEREEFSPPPRNEEGFLIEE